MRKRTQLLEYRSPLDNERVDRSKGVIYGVRVLGTKSKNGRRYLREAIKKALPLYEGISVRTDHPAKGTDKRSVYEVFGWIKNARIAEDGGIVGDLYLINPKTELSESVLNAAEKAPHLYGLSHNADGITEQEGRETIVHEVTEVRSVDLVCDPASTNGLFEQRQRGKPMKLREWFEKILATNKILEKKSKIHALLEAGYMDKEMPSLMDGHMKEEDVPDEEAPPEDHAEALKNGFRVGIMAAIDDALDGKGDPKVALARVKKLLMTHVELLDKAEADDDAEESGEEEEEEVEEGEGEEEEMEEEECDDNEKMGKGKGKVDGGKGSISPIKKMKESRNLRRRIKELENRELVRELCEELGIQVNKSQVAALAKLDTQAERTALLESMRPAPEYKRPVSQKATQSTVRKINNGEAFAKALRGEE
jgi:hypothetical protein